MNDVIAEFSDYRGMIAALREAQSRREISFATLDVVTDSADGYFSKTLSLMGSRRVTMESISLVWRGLGVKCLVVEDPEQWARMQRFMGSKGLTKRNVKLVRGGAVHQTLSRRFLKKIAVKGGTNSRKNMSKARARKLARMAALARWAKQSSKAK